jgi:hypothetical protein
MFKKYASVFKQDKLALKYDLARGIIQIFIVNPVSDPELGMIIPDPVPI